MKNMKKIASVSIISLTAIATGGFTSSIAHAVDETVTFEIASGSLAIAQTAAGTTLVANNAVDMPVTTVTDGRNDTARTGAWTVTAATSVLTAGSATIPGSNVALAVTLGSFNGTGGTVAAGGLVSATGNSINSVFTYTPTALLTIPANPNSGIYTGIVTQTVA
jgi:hypothetical protein